jgi:hypothetical protein
VIATPAVAAGCAERFGITADRLVSWLDHNGWAGWDPYALWDHRLGIWAMSRRTVTRRIADALLSRTEELFPVALRRVLGARPAVNAKAMGLFAAAFLDLEEIEGEPRLIGGRPAAEQCFAWLDANCVSVGEGVGWGYPFDWRSRLLIPSGTPTAVTSAIIADAYWLRYRRRADLAALRRCEEVCRFFLSGLRRSARDADGAFCFSYTPVDDFQVHNANLFAAELLARVGAETGRAEWVRIGIDAGRFALRELREDGTLPYWSREQSIGLEQDLYHSGFEIRMLDGLARVTGAARFREAADRYLEAWRRMFFALDGTPLMLPGVDLVEVHSCAEAILCAVQLAGRPAMQTEELPAHLERTLAAALRHLWVPTHLTAGYFAWTNRRRYGTRIRTAIPLIRWGQAWMLRAISAALYALEADR